MAASLRIEPLPGGEYRLVGEVDLSNAEEVRQIGPGGRELVLELSDLRFMDSTGLRAIIELARRLEPDGRLVLRNPNSAVDRLFEVTGIHRVSNLTIERT